MDTQIDALLAQAVDPSTLLPDRGLTLPRSWGVYELHMTRGASIRRFRVGHHPARHQALEREFGLVRTVAVFTSKSVADALQRRLNEARASDASP